MLKKIHRQYFTELLKFGVIGGLSTAINYGIFYFSYVHFGVYYLISSSFGYTAGIIFSYLGNRFWTFSPTMQNQAYEFMLYILICLISLSFSLATLNILVTAFSINPLLANVLAICVSAVSNFAGLKLFVFKVTKQ